MISQYLTTKQALKQLGIKRLATLYQYIASGKLKAYRIGNGCGNRRHFRIDRADLDSFIKSGGN